MEAADRELCDHPYTDEIRASIEASERLARTLGCYIPVCDEFASDVFADLSNPPFGVAWWEEGVPTQHRILLGDHLYHCAATVQELILEARFHGSELREVWDDEVRRWQRGVRDGNGLGVPPPERPSDDLLTIRHGAHLAGFFRSVAQVLDVLAAETIIVLDLPMSVVRAGWPGLLRALRQRSSDEDVAAAVLSAAENLGPAGWLDWTSGMRNLLVHRPGVMGLAQVMGRGMGLHLPLEPHERVDIVRYLAREPDRSLIEALLVVGGPERAYLNENAKVTIQGVHRSAVRMAHVVTTLLHAAWVRRRSSGEMQREWLAQWPEIRRSEPVGFAGYAAGSDPFEPQMMALHPTLGDRLIAAAMMDGQRQEVWEK
jgi:hypothetical protein